MDLVQVGQLSEDGLIAEGNVDEAVVSQSAHGSKSSRLLATTLGTGGNEETSVLAPEATGSPDAAGLIPESLPLGREVTVTGRNTEQNRVEGKQVRGLSNGVASLSRGVHLAEDFVVQGLGDPRNFDVSQETWENESGRTDWKISAWPPADSMPFFSASARALMWPYMEYCGKH